MRKDDNIRFRLQTSESPNKTQQHNSEKDDDDEKKDGVHPRANCIAHSTSNASLCKIFTCLLILHFVALSFNLFFDESQRQTIISPTKSLGILQQVDPQTATTTTRETPPWEKYANCTIQNPPSPSPPQNTELISSTLKPIWAPSFPNSLDEKLLKNLIYQLTGLPTGAKSYYAQRKGLRKCQGGDRDTTVVCHVVHPIIKTNPQDLTSLFNTKVVFVVRNFVTAFPVYLNYKAIKYHNHPTETQISLEHWRNLRDLYMETELQKWKEQVYEWKNKMKEFYNVALYLPFEQLIDEQKAPKLLQRLIHELQDSGFPVIVSSASENDVSCAWYKSFGRDVLQQIYDYGYEYSDYVPGYTPKQKNVMLKELSVMMEENENDRELVAILQEYYEYVHRYLVLDQPWSNDTIPIEE